MFLNLKLLCVKYIKYLIYFKILYRITTTTTTISPEQEKEIEVHELLETLHDKLPDEAFENFIKDTISQDEELITAIEDKLKS